MDVSGASGSERWSVIPGSGEVNNLGQGPGCIVADSRWWVDYLPSTGQFLVADIGHNESARHVWTSARLVGDPMPITRATPAMVYVRSARRIVMFAADGTWPGNTMVEIAVPNDIGGEWVVRRNSLGGVTPAPSTVETWRKLVVCEKAGVLLWYPGWPGACKQSNRRGGSDSPGRTRQSATRRALHYNVHDSISRIAGSRSTG